MRLRNRARVSGTNLALGIESRACGLVSEGEVADVHYRESIEYLSRSHVPIQLARSHLVYGEWLRREGRRVDARLQLRSAQMIFEATGSKAFAERTRRELLATGETVHKRTFAAYSELTPQEDQIARLASSRLTNSEIGIQLFISPRTVEWHLRKVFNKLGVTSRRELPILNPSVRPVTSSFAHGLDRRDRSRGGDHVLHVRSFYEPHDAVREDPYRPVSVTGATRSPDGR